MFDTPNIKDARPIAWLKRGMTATIVALLVIGAVSSHRAYFQVRSLEVKAPSQMLAFGDSVQTPVGCWPGPNGTLNRHRSRRERS